MREEKILSNKKAESHLYDLILNYFKKALKEQEDPTQIEVWKNKLLIKILGNVGQNNESKKRSGMQ